MAIHCPECSFINDAGANYCQKCGAYLAVADGRGGSTTASYEISHSGKLEPIALSDISESQASQAALVVRAGGGMVGERYQLAGDRWSIGRHPSSDVFLDDVTVSRNHATLVKRGNGYYIDDLGSLNGTYVNRERIDSQKLEDGDEVQIGKYRLVFLVP